MNSEIIRCPESKVFNPLSGICILEKGKLASNLAAMGVMLFRENRCDPGAKVHTSKSGNKKCIPHVSREAKRLTTDEHMRFMTELRNAMAWKNQTNSEIRGLKRQLEAAESRRTDAARRSNQDELQVQILRARLAQNTQLLEEYKAMLDQCKDLESEFKRQLRDDETVRQLRSRIQSLELELQFTKETCAPRNDVLDLQRPAASIAPLPELPPTELQTANPARPRRRQKPQEIRRWR
jgi:hypothetical protein